MGQLLRDIRSLIVFDKQEDNYKTLYFYCNWAAHPIIDRNKELYPFLEKISIGCAELPIKNSESANKFNDYIDVIIDALDFSNLTENISRLFFSFNALDKLKDKKLLLLILKNVILKKIHYPMNRMKQDLRLDITIQKTSKIHDQIEKVEKFLDPRFGSELDYSKPITFKSFQITDILDNEVFVELEFGSDKNLIMKSSIRIN
jgi:hypothetical protein